VYDIASGINITIKRKVRQRSNAENYIGFGGIFPVAAGGMWRFI
jgi:hypothetical protein